MRTRLGAEAASGKDCLRLAKSESMAKLLFRRRLAAARMGGNLPGPVAAMPERRHALFEAEGHALTVHTGETAPGAAAEAILAVKQYRFPRKSRALRALAASHKNRTRFAQAKALKAFDQVLYKEETQ